LHPWLATPPGQYLLHWEQERLDQVVADIFGFHAVQLGLAELDGLRSNRMPHRWLVVDGEGEPLVPPPRMQGAELSQGSDDPKPLRAVSVCCDFDALPFASQSLDLIVLPHALELARDPHHTLREVERVLVPEGRLVIVGFNPASLWGLRQFTGRMCRRLGFGSLFLPQAGEFLGYRRIRDWLRLLSFEIEGGRFGCYRPALRSQRWLDRFEWMEKAGDRWWPVFGSVYLLQAVKRVRGMRVVGKAWKARAKTQSSPAVATHTQRNLRDPINKDSR